MKNMEFIHIIVYSTSHALKIEALLNQQGIPNKLIPVPRHISSDCGVCVRVAADLEPGARQVVSESGIEIQGIFK